MTIFVNFCGCISCEIHTVIWVNVVMATGIFFLRNWAMVIWVFCTAGFFFKRHSTFRREFWQLCVHGGGHASVNICKYNLQYIMLAFDRSLPDPLILLFRHAVNSTQRQGRSLKHLWHGLHSLSLPIRLPYSPRSIRFGHATKMDWPWRPGKKAARELGKLLLARSKHRPPCQSSVCHNSRQTICQFVSSTTSSHHSKNS